MCTGLHFAHEFRSLDGEPQEIPVPEKDLYLGEVEDMHAAILDGADPYLSLDETRDHMRTALARDWGWALSIDFSNPVQEAQFWYVSEAKLEPRLGLRHEEPGAEMESPLDIARQVQLSRLTATLAYIIQMFATCNIKYTHMMII